MYEMCLLYVKRVKQNPYAPSSTISISIPTNAHNLHKIDSFIYIFDCSKKCGQYNLSVAEIWMELFLSEM